jgi:hypothetical protein
MHDERAELHFRRIDMRGFRRSDGLFEVEGRITDRRSPMPFRPATSARWFRLIRRCTTWACVWCSTIA